MCLCTPGTPYAQLSDPWEPMKSTYSHTNSVGPTSQPDSAANGAY